MSEGAVCIPNISAKERRKRRQFGYIGIILSLAVLAFLLIIGADRWWRLILLIFYYSAAVGFFQSREKT